MSNVDDAMTEREEIEMLLPWYVTGKLSLSDHGQVEAYLARHPEMMKQLDLIREEQSEAVAANEVIAAPSVQSLDKLMASVAQENRPHAGDFVSRIVNQVSEFFTAPSAGAVKWAAAAAAVMLMVQAVAIGALMTDRRVPGTSQTASGEKVSDAKGTFALVRFSAEARAQDIAATLSELKVKIVNGPAANGFFTIRLDTKELSEAERDARIAALRTKPAIFMLVTPKN